MTKVFIDGGAGTTGLRLLDRLQPREDIELTSLPEALRKDPHARQDAMNEADVVFLCLPDAAAIEAVSLIQNPEVCVIDTSTAHRTDPGFTYGFPEVAGLRSAISGSRRIANPGCHASGVIALIAPLIESGILSPDADLSCTSLTGYSGGGKKMIAEYEDPDRSPLLAGPRLYGLTQSHKHLPEIEKVCRLTKAPVFCPIVAPFYAGMEVILPLHTSQLKGNPADIPEIYSSYYGQGVVHFDAHPEEGNFLSAAAFANRDDMQITVCGNEDRITLISRFDNLGKGASGAALQNMNLVMGIEETTGLSL